MLSYPSSLFPFSLPFPPSSHSHTAPSGPPRELRSEAITPTSATLTWQSILCADRNAIITDYSLRWAETGTTNYDELTLSSSQLSHSIAGLIPQVSYTFGVRGMHIDTFRVPPLNLSGVRAEATFNTLPARGIASTVPEINFWNMHKT
jgi:hypothetical protein